MIGRTPARILLSILTATGLTVGLWAAFAPRAFYDDFPGGGRVWVAVDGPYNEHLVRDVGELNLALAVITIWALVSLRREAVIVASLAWVVYSLPHLVYHARHLEPLESTGDQVANIVSLSLAVLAPAVLGWTAWRNPPSTLHNEDSRH